MEDVLVESRKEKCAIAPNWTSEWETKLLLLSVGLTSNAGTRALKELSRR